jgi:hypothetical protein
MFFKQKIRKAKIMARITVKFTDPKPHAQNVPFVWHVVIKQADKPTVTDIRFARRVLLTVPPPKTWRFGK